MKLKSALGKRSLVAFAVLASFVSPFAMAQDAGWYGGLNFGQSKAKIDDPRIIRGLLSSELACEWGTLARAFEAARSSTCPTQSVTLGIGDRYRRVVKRCLDVCDGRGDVTSNLASLILNRSAGVCCCLGHSGTVPSNRNADNTCVRNGSFAERTNRNPKSDCGNKASELRNYRKSLTPFLPATVFRGPLRVRALVRVR